MSLRWLLFFFSTFRWLHIKLMINGLRVSVSHFNWCQQKEKKKRNVQQLVTSLLSFPFLFNGCNDFMPVTWWHFILSFATGGIWMYNVNDCCFGQADHCLFLLLHCCDQVYMHVTHGNDTWSFNREFPRNDVNTKEKKNGSPHVFSRGQIICHKLITYRCNLEIFEKERNKRKKKNVWFSKRDKKKYAKWNTRTNFSSSIVFFFFSTRVFIAKWKLFQRLRIDKNSKTQKKNATKLERQMKRWHTESKRWKKQPMHVLQVSTMCSFFSDARADIIFFFFRSFVL